MMRRLILSFFLLLCCCFFAASAFAQDNLTGRIYEYKTRNLLPGIHVINLRTNRYTISDQTGAYSIPARVGDLVVFMGLEYQPDTLYVKDLNYTDIQLMLKQNMLKEVRVTQQELKLGNLKAAPTLSPFGGQTLVYQTDDKGNYIGGVTLNLFDSHSAAKKRKHEEETAKDEAIKAKIAQVFSPENLQNYLPIKDQEMQNFIILYTPDVETYTNHDFNLALYLNICYKEFLKIPAEKRQSKEFLQLMNTGGN